MIRVEVNYSPRLTRGEEALLALPNRLTNLRPLMIESIAPAFNQMLERHWATRGAAFGHPWAPLAASTIASKARKGTLSRGILHDTEHLFKVLFRSRSTDDRLRRVAGGLRFQANVSVPYALFHQVGTSHMPERQVIPDPLPDSFRRRVRALVRQFILTGKTGA
jgi:hypothetical protein